MKRYLVSFFILSLGGKKESKGQSESIKANPTATLNKDDVKAIKQKAAKGQQADAIVIKASELARIKGSTKIVGKQQQAEEKKRLEVEREKERETAETLKQKIKEFDETRTKKLPATVYQKEENEKKESILNNAEKVMEQELDDVKLMNKMVHYAKCVTVRDRQLEEKQEILQQKKEEDVRIDMQMEVERLKTLKFYEEREKIHKEAHKQGILYYQNHY